jgi:hypothetical protein
VSNGRPVVLTSPELRAAARALHAIVRVAPDVQTSDAELEGAVRCLFALLHTQHVDYGWRPSGLTLAPWAVEIVARLLAAPVAAALPAPNKRTVKARLRPAVATRRAVEG